MGWFGRAWVGLGGRWWVWECVGGFGRAWVGLGGHEWVWEGVVGFGMAWVGSFVYLMNNFDLERYCF